VLLLEILERLADVILTTAADGTRIYFPCPFKETEAAVALKSIEASSVAALADLRFGKKKRTIEGNLEQTACSLFSTYIATIGGLGKQDKNVKSKLNGNHRIFAYDIISDCFLDTDLLKAQSILYRRLAANLYETKIPGE
jgi:hypothetical protein